MIKRIYRVKHKYRTRIQYPRRKWSRRGRYLGDFIFGFATAGIEHIVTAIGRFCRYVINKTRWHRKNKASVNKKQLLKESGVNSSKIQDLQGNFRLVCGKKPSVFFKDVAGLEGAKREIELRMILPLRFPRLAEQYGTRRGGGLLLYGPPGTGKTMLAKACATELEAIFYHIRPSDIMSGQVGQAEKNIAILFDQLRKETRAVLFLDEVECFVPSRKRNTSTIMQRVISQILGEVDGIRTKSDGHILFLIGATNEPCMIDKAMLRPGRFDTKIYVGPPDSDARRHMLEMFLSDKPVSEEIDLDQLVLDTVGLTGAEIKELINKATDKAFLESIQIGRKKFLTNQTIDSCLHKITGSLT